MDRMCRSLRWFVLDILGHFTRGASPQMSIDCMRWEAEPFQSTSGACVCERFARSKEFLECDREAFVFSALCLGDTALCRTALDSASDEFGNESRVADRLNAAVDEELREQRVVDEPVAFARFDGFANVVVVVAAPRETRPQLRFGQPPLCEKAKRGYARPARHHSSLGAPAAASDVA
jgi:hypothetical protein